MTLATSSSLMTLPGLQGNGRRWCHGVKGAHVEISQRVSNIALANAALVLSSKNRKKNIREGGQCRIINPKSLGLSAAVREYMPL